MLALQVRAHSAIATIREQFRLRKPVIRWMSVKTIKSGSDGDLAFNIGSVSMTQPLGDGRVNVKGKYLDVYWRQKDGSWKIIATMYNTDKPTR